MQAKEKPLPKPGHYTLAAVEVTSLANVQLWSFKPPPGSLLLKVLHGWDSMHLYNQTTDDEHDAEYQHLCTRFALHSLKTLHFSGNADAVLVQVDVLKQGVAYIPTGNTKWEASKVCADAPSSPLPPSS